jgi:hypothetical protein
MTEADGASRSPAPAPNRAAPGQAPAAVCGFGYPHSQILQAWATCGFFCVFPMQTVEFVPPRIVFLSSIVGKYQVIDGHEFKLNVPSEWFVVVPCGPELSSSCDRPNPINVKLTPTGPFVSLNGQPSGQPITVMIPAQSLGASFSIKALQVGNPAGDVSATAPGLQATGFLLIVVP